MARYNAMRGARMKRILEISTAGGVWTTQQYARRLSMPTQVCYQAVTRLVAAGYLEDCGEIKNPRGGRAIGLYRWTGKQDAPQTADFGLIFRCMAAMVSTGRMA